MQIIIWMMTESHIVCVRPGTLGEDAKRNVTKRRNVLEEEIINQLIRILNQE